MAATAGKTGKAGNITISSQVVPITKVTPKATMQFANATDSGNYDPVSSNLYTSQLAGETNLTLAISGYWDANTTSTDITAKFKAPGSGPWPMVVKLDGSTTLCSGNFDISDVEFDVTVPGATMVGVTFNAMSNGAYVLT